MLWQSRLVLHDVACIECNLAQDTNAGFQLFPPVAIQVHVQSYQTEIVPLQLSTTR
jgi:hypothetical protein